MKKLIASVAAATLIATPAIAAQTGSSTKTVTTKAPGAKATTTVTTKVSSSKGATNRQTKHHKMAVKAPTAKKPATTKS